MSFQLDSRIPLGFQGYDPQVGQRNALLRLQMQAAERDLDEQNALRSVLDRAGGGLSADDPAKRAAAAAELAQAGPRGYQIAAPILTGVRNERQISQIMGGMGGGAPAAAPAAPGGDVLTRIAAVESGGNDAARNPGSSAAGRFQITDGTWGSYAPRLGLRPDQRMDPAAQEQVARAIQADAQQAIGRPLNPGEQYAAHFLGVGGLRAFLSADPGADAQQVYAQAAGPGVAQQAFARNPGLLEPGLTVGQVLQRISGRVGGGGPQEGAARPSMPGQQPTPAQFAQLVQAAAAGNDVAQRLVQMWAPFMRQENAPEPLERIRAPDGSERLVPRREAAGMVSAPAPQAGSEGDRLRARYLDLDGRRGGLNQREAQELALIERQMTMPQTLVDATGSIRVVQPPPLPRAQGETVPLSDSAAPQAAGGSDAAPAVVPSGTRAPASTTVPGGATVTTIPGQRPAQPLDGTTRRDLVDLGGRLSTLGRLSQSFNDRYGGYAVSGVGQAVAAAGRVFGDTSGMSQWWQDYQEFKNIIRNQLFGAALTATEKAEFDRAAINPGMAPSQIRTNLGRQLEIAQGVARRQAQTLVNDNFNPESVASALGVPLEQIGAARDPAMQAGPGGRGVAAPPPPAPRAGDVQDGFRFRGGDPSRRESWERVR